VVNYHWQKSQSWKGKDYGFSGSANPGKYPVAYGLKITDSGDTFLTDHLQDFLATLDRAS